MNDSAACRVLLVEDDPGDAHLIRQLLRANREPLMDIFSAATLAEAQRHLSENPPEILLLDLSLPDSCGLDTVRAARQAADGLPIVVLTGRDDTAFALQALEAGAQDYLLKGRFDQDALVRAIRYAITRSRLEQRLQDSEERWRFALEGTGDGMWDWNVDSNEVYFSTRWKAMLGFSENEIDHNFAAWQARIHPEDILRVAAELQAYFDGNSPGYSSEHRILCKDGDWLWVLDRGMVVSRAADGKPLRMIGTQADISKRKLVEESIRHLAQHDVLTDLPNRALFFDRLHQALAKARRDKAENPHLALMYIDLDKFKPVNDTLGHAIGDLLLKEVARRMLDCVRESDTVARLGGDEFVVLLPAIETAHDAGVVAEKIRRVLAQPFVISEFSLSISSSIGVAIYPEDGINETQLTRNADDAMYRAKDSGRDNVQFYRPPA
ncbi:MAG: diguanylate cyclase [Betaproteobacteria bacterium]|nr:diguanylate cyclase [Betaproteobacteria bacterium]